MATNPQAEGQTKINFQISDSDKATLQRLADASGMKLSAYVRMVLEDAVAAKTVYTRHRATAAEVHPLAAEDTADQTPPRGKLTPAPYPKRGRKILPPPEAPEATG